MSYDEKLDKVIAEHAPIVLSTEKNVVLLVSLRSYDGGAPRISIRKRGEKWESHITRLDADAALKMAAAVVELLKAPAKKPSKKVAKEAAS